ncbi:MAG: hypothetical protein ACI4NA_04580 [Succinivibrio sp.]
MKRTATMAAVLAALAISEAAIADQINFPLELSERTFNIKSQGFKFRALIPGKLHETFLQNPQMESYTYSNSDGILEVSFQLIALSGAKYSEVVGGKFQELVTKPFGDKEHHLYGEYEILRDDHHGSDRTFEYEGFLRKQQDGFGPAMHTLMHESYMLRGRHLLKVACHVRGLQEQREISEAIFRQADTDCTKIINSVTVYGK